MTKGPRPPEDLNVREGQAADIQPIVALWRTSMAQHAQKHPIFTPKADGHIAFERFLAEHMAANDAAVVVAEAGGEIVGYGICQLRRRPAYFEPIEHGLISDLEVAASHRRRGVGELILGALCNWLAGRGLTRVEIEVATANEIAVSFWRKWGFETYCQTMGRTL
ncbi:hypothetical protein DDF65_15200 [Caulobacter radicis]|uniref:N-acetyltransferase domain-containing protein n=2 Tax=Caulobacteraceae TaxID=76892 RepID=A0A2T9JB38_9CAUL|nr:hypothetical protein DDF65_15200 [Caulobacter radicis]